ncbi:hypothetical protein ACFSJW_13520 [Flavobacterium artemisiae]|uniref:Uncharacterized protein n=1 Tax=Flavobacterium artemisiae TaxID=2126556 RepID=A0ABW4HFS4_9FLAO
MQSYFLTGSCRDQDNDFELIIRTDNVQDEPKYILSIEDISSPERICWESALTDFTDALKRLSDFMMENRIRFYGKNATSSPVDPIIDKLLQDFIYSKTPELL